MAYLVAAAERRDLGMIQKSAPETWRRVRRYNLPIQLALAAAEEVMSSSRDPKTATVISLAPCQPGSADLYRWGDVVTSGMAKGTLGDLRMNPTQTLHAVDNLAMSAFAIAYGNQADCLGLGGAAGQAWSGIEAVLEKLDSRSPASAEVLLMAGDQDTSDDGAKGVGVALLFAKQPRPFVSLRRHIRLVRLERTRLPQPAIIRPHAATGLCEFVAGARQQAPGLFAYDVPLSQTDGFSAVTIILEISS